MKGPEFEEFFRSMHPKLVRYAQRRVVPDRAEDLAAATLQVIWEKDPPAPADDEESRKLQSLAYRVLEGLLHNAGRADAAYRNALLRAERLHDPTRHVGDVADHVVSDGWPEWAERLSLTDREVLGLLVDGYTVGEIAVILDCSPAAVTMRLRRAKERVRRLWPRGGGG